MTGLLQDACPAVAILGKRLEHTRFSRWHGRCSGAACPAPPSASLPGSAWGRCLAKCASGSCRLGGIGPRCTERDSPGWRRRERPCAWGRRTDVRSLVPRPRHRVLRALAGPHLGLRAPL